jgi:transcriptional regulator GlxA family with amidase domain
MRVAAQALVYSDQLMAQVPTNCGFPSQSHFSREFRRCFGRSPRKYREHYALGKAAAPGTKFAAAEQ